MSFQAYNMIPSHGIRSGFGMRHVVFSCFFFFSFLGCFACGYPKISCGQGPLGGKVLRVSAGREGGPRWACGFRVRADVLKTVFRLKGNFHREGSCVRNMMSIFQRPVKRAVMFALRLEIDYEYLSSQYEDFAS